MMRLLSGTLKGKALPLHDSWVRPTSAYRRLMIFNRLQHAEGFSDFTNKRVVDVFAGTGALGLEALSRGASHVSLIEKNPKTHEKLQAFIAKNQLANRTSLLLCDATQLPPVSHPYDLCFLDAPYHKDLIPLGLESLYRQAWVKKHTFFVAETDVRENLPLPPWVTLSEKRVKGRTAVWFFYAHTTQG